MKRWKNLFGVLSVAILLAAGKGAMAKPVLCSPGYQDSTCGSPVSHAAIPQTQCSAGAGWTTLSPAVWQGAQWSAPQCSYTAPPTCQAGYSQTASPWWTGSSWVGISCAPPPPPSTDDQDPFGYCSPRLAQPGYTMGAPLRLTSWPEVVSGLQNSPYNGQLIYAWYMSGPTYSLSCKDSNLYVGACYFSSADHHFLGAQISQGEGGQGGNCAH
ncbi:hypothetical protein PTKU15_86080 [Paraburkholderia terrae]|nr:hypothetical protein PTKU15_86080 [Paraburkholderia terrae]